MTVTRLADGLWQWTAPHPEWDGATDWDEVVSSVYCETPNAVVVVDPLVPEDGPDAARFWTAFDRDVERLDLPVAVLVTCRWHVRSAARFRDRHGARVFAPTMTGPTVEGLVTDLVTDGAEVLPGVVALVTGSPPPNEECVYLLTGHGAAVIGDIALGDTSGGLRIADPAWYANSDVERAWYRHDLAVSLERLLEHDLLLLLPGHGAPVGPDAATALGDALTRHRVSVA